MILKRILSFFCIHQIQSLVPPAPIFSSPSNYHDFMNIALPLIVPAHGSVDVLHSIQENKTINYIGAGVIAYSLYPLIDHFSQEASLCLFLSMSAYHFRHQFSFISKDYNLLFSSIFVGYGLSHPEILYTFLAFIHTPHQYWKFRQNMLNDKLLSTLLVTTLTTVGMFVSYSDWNDNVFITSTLIAHIIYQEYLRFKSVDPNI